jgi:hypothetical protein
LAFSNPSETTLNIWAVPEPILHASLSSLPPKAGGQGQEYTIQIFTGKQRIEHYAASPDLAPYFRQLERSPQELRALEESRDVDALVKSDRDTANSLTDAGKELTEAGVFDPSEITDARERILSAIVRRRGQPAFREHLLIAYRGQCAITGCALEAVLDAAHIIPYKGPETNHPANGLLLRTDLHTLFDLKLIAVDVQTMSLLVSPSLADTCYEEYRGKRITIPDDPSSRPSQEALRQHCRESGLGGHARGIDID